MIQKLKDRFEWAKCKESLSRDDMLEELYEDVSGIIEEQRQLISKLMEHIVWQRRRNLMPYDFNFQLLFKLCGEFKIDIGDGHIKKQDKRGYWR